MPRPVPPFWTNRVLRLPDGFRVRGQAARTKMSSPSAARQTSHLRFPLHIYWTTSFPLEPRRGLKRDSRRHRGSTQASSHVPATFARTRSNVHNRMRGVAKSSSFSFAGSPERLPTKTAWPRQRATEPARGFNAIPTATRRPPLPAIQRPKAAGEPCLCPHARRRPRRSLARERRACRRPAVFWRPEPRPNRPVSFLANRRGLSRRRAP